jgi:hypothetical protein
MINTSDELILIENRHKANWREHPLVAVKLVMVSSWLEFA